LIKRGLGLWKSERLPGKRVVGEVRVVSETKATAEQERSEVKGRLFRFRGEKVFRTRKIAIKGSRNVTS